jgi:hypothetical protein
MTSLPLPASLHGDDLLELAALAKALRDDSNVELSPDEAFQLGEGVEILAADLAETKRQLEEARADLERWSSVGTRKRSDGSRIARTIAAPQAEAPDTLMVDVPIAGGGR